MRREISLCVRSRRSIRDTKNVNDGRVGWRGEETGEKRDFSLRRPTLSDRIGIFDRRSEGERKRWPASFEMTGCGWGANGSECRCLT